MKPGGAVDSPEFELVLACLRWPQEHADGDRIRALARQPLDWIHLLEIVQHHKVVPLFARNLNSFAAEYVPQETAAALRTSTVSNAHLCLQRASELFALNRLFREQQIDLRVFKGVPLAISAFHDPTLRDAGDIDLLVAEKDLFRAEAILQAEGYRRFDPQARLTPRRLRSYMAHQKDFSYEHPVSGAVIDLHWRLFRNAWLPANARIEEVGEDWVALGSERIPTLPAPSLLLYLCMHGALDGWLRLKWLADIGALLQQMTAEQLAQVVAAAKQQHALAQLSAAIALCHDMLGAPAPPPGCLPGTDPGVARIMRFSQRLITSNRCRPIREDIPGTDWLLNEFQLHGSLRYRWDLMVRSLFRPRVWQSFDLPDALFPLYALLSPVEWCLFHLRHRARKLTRPLRQKIDSKDKREESARWPLRRLLRTPPSDFTLAVEALCMLTFFRVALHFIPVQRLTTWMAEEEQGPAISQRTAALVMRRIEWSIDAVVRHAPLRFVCFPQCLAAYFMLRRRHIPSKLFYGVARDADQLKAHTWVKVGDRTVVGGEAESQFTVLHTFP